MKEYTIKGNHPVAKRIDHIVIGWSVMSKELGELLEAGYEVTIEMRHLTNRSSRCEKCQDIDFIDWQCPYCGRKK